MTASKDDHEKRLARLEHMMEELRVQTEEYIRLTTEARLEAQAVRAKSQAEREARQPRNTKNGQNRSRRKPR
jgi:hypothetical protein